MTWIYCFIKSVANTYYVEDNSTTLQMMGLTQTAGKIFHLQEFYTRFRSCCYIVTRCTNLVSVHYFLPLGI